MLRTWSCKPRAVKRPDLARMAAPDLWHGATVATEREPICRAEGREAGLQFKSITRMHRISPLPRKTLHHRIWGRFRREQCFGCDPMRSSFADSCGSKAVSKAKMDSGAPWACRSSSIESTPDNGSTAMHLSDPCPRRKGYRSSPEMVELWSLPAHGASSLEPNNAWSRCHCSCDCSL